MIFAYSFTSTVAIVIIGTVVKATTLSQQSEIYCSIMDVDTKRLKASNEFGC